MAGKLLEAGNEVLIVSKPWPECISYICKNFKDYKDQIVFRFTVGAIDNSILSFWEPGAPSYEKRKESLMVAYNLGFSTSLSLEPILDTANIDSLIDDLIPYVTGSIWIGKMNRIRHQVRITDKEVEQAVQMITAGRNR